MKSNPLRFMDRNILWQETKKHKILKAKEIVDQRQERECPFRPQIPLIQKTSRSRDSRSRDGSVEEKSRVSLKVFKQ